nr:hypothetical protein [Tanacetum cinerariifolium]
MRRVGKGFSEVETPLFEGMIVAQQADDVADEGAVDVDVYDVPTATAEPSIPSPTPSMIVAQQADDVADEGAVDVDVYDVPTAAAEPSIPSPTPKQDKVAQALEIIQLNQRVKKSERKNKVKVSGLRRLRKVGTAQRVKSSTDTVMDDQEDASKHREIIANIDADEDVTLKDVAAVEKTAEIKDVHAQFLGKIITTGNIVGILDLMIQKSNKMKQKDQSCHCGTLQAGGVI